MASSIITTGTPAGKEEAILKTNLQPTQKLLSRLESWVQVVDLIDNYVDSHITIQKHITQGLEKARKAVADAPRFNYSVASATITEVEEEETAPETPTVGIAESFESLRTTTDSLINKSLETEQSLKTSVLPQLSTLKGDIEKHIKGLKGNGVKNAKDIEKARSLTQASIEQLGQYVSSFAINTNHKLDYKNDPYVLHRNVLNALEDQVAKENNQIDALISVEKNLETLEVHILQVIQQAVTLLDTALSSYSNLKVDSYHNIAATFNAIPSGFEWDKFINNPNSEIVAYNTPKRQIDNIYFTNSDAVSVKPVLEGILQRKEGKLLKSYSSSYYVLTPSRFLLQYSSQDHVQNPTPDFAIYIPDAQVGEMSSRSSGKNKFVIQAKDTSRTIGIGHKNYAFKTNTYDELVAWHDAITGKKGVASPLSPASPISPSIAAFSSPVVAKEEAFESEAPAYAEDTSAVVAPTSSVSEVTAEVAATKLV